MALRVAYLFALVFLVSLCQDTYSLSSYNYRQIHAVAHNNRFYNKAGQGQIVAHDEISEEGNASLENAELQEEEEGSDEEENDGNAIKSDNGDALEAVDGDTDEDADEEGAVGAIEDGEINIDEARARRRRLNNNRRRNSRRRNGRKGQRRRNPNRRRKNRRNRNRHRLTNPFGRRRNMRRKVIRTSKA